MALTRRAFVEIYLAIVRLLDDISLQLKALATPAKAEFFETQSVIFLSLSFKLRFLDNKIVYF